MDCNNVISGCVTVINDDSIVIDESKFPMLDLPISGEEFDSMELGVLICSSEI